MRCLRRKAEAHSERPVSVAEGGDLRRVMRGEIGSRLTGSLCDYARLLRNAVMLLAEATRMQRSILPVDGLQSAFPHDLDWSSVLNLEWRPADL